MIVVSFGCVMCTLCQGHVNKKGVPSLCITPWTSPRSDFRGLNHGYLTAGLADISPVSSASVPTGICGCCSSPYSRRFPYAPVRTICIPSDASHPLHGAEEGFLRCIVLAVSASRHRLDDIMPTGISGNRGLCSGIPGRCGS